MGVLRQRTKDLEAGKRQEIQFLGLYLGGVERGNFRERGMKEEAGVVKV